MISHTNCYKLMQCVPKYCHVIVCFSSPRHRFNSTCLKAMGSRSERTERKPGTALGEDFAERNMASKEEVINMWKVADAVCFDVDSTVIREEAIDELAAFCGKGEEVAKLTEEAMKGSMNFREAFARRLDIIKPQMSQLRDFISARPHKLTPGIKELVEALHQRSTPVYLVSGGMRGLVTPVALELNIPLENVFANRLKFFFNGDYAGFDENEPTSKTGGKGEVIRNLKDKYGYSNLVLIGDGATDLEACPPADAFIGFGGNVVREAVKAKAQWYVTDFKELLDALQE